MESDDESATRPDDGRRARVGWQGIVVGLAVAALVVAVMLRRQAVPDWHRDGAPFPSDAIATWVTTLAATVTALTVLDLILARFPRAGRLRLVAPALALVVAAGGVGWYLAHRLAVASASKEANYLAAHRYDVPHAVAAGWFVTGLAGAALAGLLVAGWTRRHGERRTAPRRWYVPCATAATVVALLASLAGWRIAAPDHHGPVVTAAKPFAASVPNEPSGFGEHQMVRLSAGSSGAPDGPGDVTAVVPLPAGVALATDSSLVGFAANGNRLWSVDFPSSIDHAFGSSVSRTSDTSVVLVQTNLYTYGVDGMSGQVKWSSDAIPRIIDAAGTKTWGDDQRSRFGALVDAPAGEDVRTEWGERGDADLVMIDGTDGSVRPAHQFRDAKCAAPEKVWISDASAEPVVVVADECAAPTARLLATGLVSGRTSTDFSSVVAEPGETLTIEDAKGDWMVVTARNRSARTRRSIVVTNHTPAPTLPAGYVATTLLGPADAYHYLVAAIDPDGRQVIVYGDLDKRRTMVTPTGVTSLMAGGTWAYTGDGAVSAAGYAAPQGFTDRPNGPDPQTAPLTVVRGVDYPSDGSGPTPMTVTTMPSPCRQGLGPNNRVLQVGGGVVIWCSSNGVPFTEEVFAVS